LFYSKIDHGIYQGKAYPVVIADLDGTNQQVIAQGLSLSAAAGKILYLKAHGEFQDSVIIANDDGSSPKTLYVMDSTFRGWGWPPVLSPDGTQVLYAFRDAGQDHVTVQVQNVNSGMIRTLDYVRSSETIPSFSQDGKYVVYYDSKWNSGGNYLKIAATDGTGARVLTSVKGGGFDLIGRVAWRPNSQQLAYYEEGDSSIYVINSDGSGSYPAIRGVLPVWSPDGSKLAYTGGDIKQHADLFVTADFGLTSENITNTDNIYEAYPRWSPDGKTLYALQWTGDYDNTAQTLVTVDPVSHAITPLTSPADYVYVTR
jgi:Tol biopolymer transport system component